MAAPAKRNRLKLKLSFKRFYESVWLYPTILGVILFGLTAFKVSGSSIGIYHSILYGNENNPELLLNQPRPIRSDEWLVNTQMTIVQFRDHYPAINPAIGKGEDMTIGTDVPSKDWSTVFRPQNLAFFVLPFNQAFAFRWWLWPFLLTSAVYFFVLKFLPGKRLFAALISLAVTASPFIVWWFLAGTIAPIFFSLTILLVAIGIIETDSRRRQLILAAVLAYLMVCFALILYPPFQIASVLALVSFFVGYLLEQHRQVPWKDLFLKLLWVAGAAGIAAVVSALFVATHLGAIRTTANTVYPGVRDIHSGGLSWLQLFTSQLSPILQSNSRGANFFTNQSEASNFIFIAPFLIVPSLYLSLRQKQKKGSYDWPMITVNVFITLLLVRVFVPGANIIYKLLLLNKVQHARLIIGFGLLQLMQIVLIIRNQTVNKWKFPLIGAMAFSVITLISYLYSGFFVKQHFPIFLHPNETVLVLGAAFFMAGLVFALLRNWGLIFASALMVFTLLSVFHVHPLLKNIGQEPDPKIMKIISSYDGGKWVVMDSVVFENLPLDAGKSSLTGVNYYPQLDLWHELDPDRAYSDIYNRYAHVYFTLSDGASATFNLHGTDNFSVAWDPCSQFTHTEDIRYALSQNLLNNRCLTLVNKVDYPQLSFYIYKTVPPAL
ncbi:MAG TPA: hypothetical protein VLE72_02615 [Candidatus Saccharimonadales bacterium]|nr:hypothetical protein [Candidatus Saccharimonadales bacterium]